MPLLESMKLKPMFESTVTCVDDLGMSADQLGLDPDLPLTLLGSGFNSVVYSTGVEVVKITVGKLVPKATALEQSMQYEHNLNTTYLGIHCPKARIRRQHSDSTGLSHVVTVQDLIVGKPIAEHLLDPTADDSDIQDLLIQALKMHSKTRKLPDIANIETFFNPLVSPNIMIDDENRSFAVDSTFGRIQRARYAGVLWTPLMVRGVANGLKKLTN
jgi:hypothetical protein